MSTKDMEMLEVDKNAKLVSRIDPDLIRTGTVGDGTCFFHSVLKGISQEYTKTFDGKKTTEKTKREMGKTLRQKVSESITVDFYTSMFEGVLAKIHYSERVHTSINLFYSFMDDTESFVSSKVSWSSRKFVIELIKKNIKSYEMIVNILDHDTMDKIRSKVFDASPIQECKQKWSDDAVGMFLSLVDQSVEKEDEVFEAQRKLVDLIDLICDFSMEMALKRYKEELSDCSKWATEEMFRLVSDFLEIDIYFITEETGLPYRLAGGCENMMSGKRRSVIVGSIGGGHFESIGYKKSSSEVGKGIIQRVFEHDDPLIVKLHAINCVPEKVKEDYPEFIDLIPIELR